MPFKRAIAHLDDLFGSSSPSPSKKKKKARSPARSERTSADTASSSSTNGGNDNALYQELPRSLLSKNARACPEDYVDTLLYKMLSAADGGGTQSRAQSTVKAKIKNKVVTLQNQSRAAAVTGAAKKVSAARSSRGGAAGSGTAALDEERAFPFSRGSRMGSKALRRRGLDFRRNVLQSARLLSMDDCAVMHQWWREYASSALERHRHAHIPQVLARIDLHGAPVTVTGATADPLLVGVCGTLLQQTKHTFTLFNAETGQWHSSIPKRGTTLSVVVGEINAHIKGDSLVASW